MQRETGKAVRNRMKYISIYPMISGMISQTIFLFRYITTRPITRKEACCFQHCYLAFGGVVTYYIVGHALKPLKKFSDKIEEVQAQNLSDSRIEENEVKELNQLSVSYNKMLERLSEAFEMQRQFTANAAHELRTR